MINAGRGEVENNGWHMQEQIEILSHPIDSTITIPGSKSMTNRVLLLAALAQGESRISGILISDDTEVMAEALSQAGVKINLIEDLSAQIIGCSGSFPNLNLKQDPNFFIKIYTHESGTATRFLIPALAACGHGKYYLYGSERMMDRPLEPQLKALGLLGVKFDFEENKLFKMPFFMGKNNLKNKLNGGEIYIDIKDSSQFLSGLLMAAPYATGPIVLKSTQNIFSKPYVLMTVKLMEKFGVKVDLISPQELKIEPSAYQACELIIEPDMSTASYFFAIPALVGGSLHIKNCSRKDSLQGDIKFLEILEQMGCEIIQKNNGITVRYLNVSHATKLKSLGEINMSGFSDTFMTIAVLACFCDAPVILHGLAHTRLQESDRVSAIAQGLNKLGIKTEETPDSLKIYPFEDFENIKNNKNFLLESFNDHRIAMSLALMGLKIPGVIINNSQAVGKTCPEFFKLLEKCRGESCIPPEQWK